jgi:hypothetical protein
MSTILLIGSVIFGIAAFILGLVTIVSMAKNAWRWMARTWHQAAAEHNPDTRAFVAVRGIVEQYIRQAHVEPVGCDSGRAMVELAQVLGFLDEKGRAK